MGQVKEMLDAMCGRTSFHMPGHHGRVFGGEYDTTELTATDDLHEPKGPYVHLQQKAAELNQAACSFLLVGGSTLGVEAMLLSCLKPGDKLLLMRTAHVSAWSACVLGGFSPVSIYPGYDKETGMISYTKEDVLLAMDSAPDAKAVLLTQPDFYGRCLPLDRVAEKARERGMYLLVDEAHGAHLPFLENGVLSAGAQGADLWCQSLHKTLPALTQTAVLHLKDAGLAEKNRAVLRMLESSSPSSLLLLSAEQAYEKMEKEGTARLRWLRGRIEKLGACLDARYSLCRFEDQDPTRLVIDVRGTGYSGYEVLRKLAEKGVDMEMADELRIVGIPSVMSTEEDFQKLETALCSIEGRGNTKPLEKALQYGVPCMDMRKAFFSEREEVSLEKAVGRISAASFGLYPPGVPLAAAGERITQELIRCMIDAMGKGSGSFGMTRKGEVSCVITQ